MGSTDTKGNQLALQNASAAHSQYQKDYGQWQNQYENAYKNGQQIANQQLDQGARAATTQAQLAGRQAGLSKGQAAMNAAGAANQMYQNNYNQAVQSAVGQQQSNAMQGMGMAQQGQSNAMSLQHSVGNSQTSDYDKNMGTIGFIGEMAGGVAKALPFSDKNLKIIDGLEERYGIRKKSDERIKEPTPERDLIAEVAEEINNYTYHYKPGVGEDPSIEYSGPMAQDLLQVDGYRSCVVEDPKTGILRVDAARLALTNAGMIADLSKRLLMLEEFINQVMSGLTGAEQMPDVE